MDGYVTTQLLYVAAKLGVADVLADGARTGAEIAEAVGADTALLGRALRDLVHEDVLSEEDGHFALTPLGEWLREGVPGSLRGPIMVRGDVYYGVAAGLLATVVDGGVACEHVHGERFFEHLGRHPDLVVSGLDGRPGGARGRRRGRGLRLRDVRPAGGRGRRPDVLLGAILRAAPQLRAVLVDRPAVVEGARGWLERQGVGERCECVAGDFFSSVPRGGDAYLLSRVIHDWDDADAHKIGPSHAHAARRARAHGGGVPAPAGGRGLTARRVAPTRSPAGLSVIEATL
jgi:O-methyltransferase